MCNVICNIILFTTCLPEPMDAFFQGLETAYKILDPSQPPNAVMHVLQC